MKVVPGRLGINTGVLNGFIGEKRLGKVSKMWKNVWNVHNSGPKAPTEVRTPPILTRGHILRIRMGPGPTRHEKRWVVSILEFGGNNLKLKRKIIITWSKVKFLGSGGKENVEKGVMNPILTTLRAKGGKKLGKVGLFMKVCGHIAMNFYSDYHKWPRSI